MMHEGVYKNPLVFFENGIGDYFINLPAIRALNHLFDGNLTLLTGNLNIRAVKNEGLKKVEPISTEPGIYGRTYNIEDLRQAMACHDLYINLNPWYCRDKHEAYLQFLAEGSFTSAGYFSFYDHPTRFSNNKNAFDIAFDIPRAFDTTLDIERFAYPPVFDEQANELTRKIRTLFPEECLLLGVQDETGKEKMLPAELFEQTIDRLLDEYPYLAVLILGCNTSIRWQTLRNSGRVLFFEQQVPLITSCALMQAVDLFLGIDSVFLHLADLVRKPAVGLFGPSSEIEWGLRFTEGKIIRPQSGKMEDIQVDDIIQAMRTIIEKHLILN